ncbi:MAG: malate:quinone oxidoreductase, partial [Lautropia sp.]|nr:malate:quinone oxidoreductase [Lautropia sp.]
LNDSAALTNQVRKMTSDALKLPHVDVPLNLGKTAAPAAAAAEAEKAAADAIRRAQDKARNANSEMQAP